MCADLALRAGLGASCEVWLFQMSGEQRRHARNAAEGLHTTGRLRRTPRALPAGCCMACEWSNHSQAPRLASIPVVCKRIFRFLLK